MEFLKKNWIYILGGLVALFLFFPKLFKGSTRRRHRHHVKPVVHRRRRTLPRSVGMHKRRTVRRSHGAKKPWQIKGSRAAKLRMARIRRKKR